MQVQGHKRTILIGIIVWLLFFGWWFRGFLFRNWQFRLFSFDSWRHLIHEFRSGWHISAKSDWIFVLSFIAAPFIFALLWYLAQKIQWLKLLKKIWRISLWPFYLGKKKRLQKEIAAYEPKQPIVAPQPYRPQAMPTTVKHSTNTATQPQMSFLNNSTAMGDFSSTPIVDPVKEFNDYPKAGYTTEPAPQPHPFTNEAFAEMADTPLSEIQIPKMEPVNEDISALFEKNGFTLLPPILVSGRPADFVAVSQNELIVALCDKEPGDWLADEESFNDEDPLWFSETDHRVSPVFQLKNVTTQLQQKLGDTLRVYPLLIEKEGVIINAEDMMKTWNDLGVGVCRTGSGGPVELPTCSELLKEPQEKISPETLEKVKSML